MVAVVNIVVLVFVFVAVYIGGFMVNKSLIGSS